jgi:2-keto-4-pentenoate hydratase/2-oxohepta-3-ene-1,7-dioic acid hydratase in catechol pathway
MRLASYTIEAEPCFGLVTADGVITLNKSLCCTSLREALGKNLLSTIGEIGARAKADHRLSDISFLPVIPDPELIACAGINYRSHATETGRDIPR